MILHVQGTIFKNFGKISDIAIFKKCVQKLTKAKFQVFGVFSVTRPV